MNLSMDNPFIIFIVSFLLMWLSERFGASVLRKRRQSEAGTREDFSIIIAAALTLLGLIIGFSFSMAVSRYDQRKNFEEAEANAIGTEFVRADLLPATDGARVRMLLKQYLDQRILFYTVSEKQHVRQINARTALLESELWSAVLAPATAQPNAVVALAVAGMNDVLNSEGYTQAAWWNRIPIAAWILMTSIAICCNVLIGYGERNTKVDSILLLFIPLVVSISFYLIADIDSPRGGSIKVIPQNLISTAESLRGK